MQRAGILIPALLLALVSVAQITVSTIRGSVSDPSGAVVPNAQVELTNTDTGYQRLIKTTANGDFEFPDLGRGVYVLRITAPGFATFTADRILLEATQVRRIDATLQLSSVGADVTVRADAAVITTETAKLQGGYSSRRFEESPMIGQVSPLPLLTTLPLVQNTGGIFSVQFAGQPMTQIQSAVDGIGAQSTLNGTSGMFYEEVNVITGSASAEYSRPVVMSMISKSGSNQWHGRTQYWHTNSALNARPFFSPANVQSKTHNMQADFSGPAIKNKTFFFVLWSGARYARSTFYLRDVPTRRMRNGDFSELLAGSRPITIKDPSTNQPFPGNIIPRERFNAVSLKALQSYIPEPNMGDGLARNFGFVHPYPDDTWKSDAIVFRVDHRFNDKNTVWVRQTMDMPRYVLAGSYPGFFWTRVRHSRNFAVEDTHVFSPGLVATFRFGLYQPKYEDGTDVGGNKPLLGNEAVQSLGLQGVNPQNLTGMGFPTMSITGYSTLSMPAGGVAQDYREWNFAQSTTWATGRHVIKFGGEYIPSTTFDGSVPAGTFGSFNFNGSITGYAFSDFLLGIPFSSTRLVPLTGRTRTDSDLGLYVQDGLKAGRRLTIDLGLRWDAPGTDSYKDGLIYNWDPKTSAVIVPEAALKSVSPLYPTDRIKVRAGQVQQQRSWRNVYPRFGAAFRPTEKSVIRGGYGIFIETISRFSLAFGGGPYQLGETFNNVLRNGVPDFAFPNAFPASPGVVASQSVSGFDPEVKYGRIHQFNLAVERQIRDIGLRLSYVGSRSRDMNYNIAINKPQPSLIPFTQNRRPYPEFIGVSWMRIGAASNYNALTVQGERRAGSFVFNAHYTLASNFNNTNNLENPYAPLMWSRDAATARHRAVISTIWQLPFGRGRRLLSDMPRIADHVLGGWQFYWVATMQSGQYFSPSFSGSDPSNTNTVGGLPDRIKDGNLPRGERTINRWFDAAAFVPPPPGRFGNSGANILEGPGLHLHNLSISKMFSVTERLRFTLTAAAQNAVNHPNFGMPSANISVPGSVGVISSTRAMGGAREMMLRGRLDF